MERLPRELAHVRHRLEVLVKTRRVVGLTAEERAEFDRLTERESELLQLVGDSGAATDPGPSRSPG
jgi:hypothetical protein